jgi:hypothetical protein
MKVRFLAAIMIIQLTMSCHGSEKIQVSDDNNPAENKYTVYIINTNIHTGIFISINDESAKYIEALKYYTDYEYADFGWGEETVYQTHAETYCMDAKAILLVNPSVVRVEGYNGTIESLVKWSGFSIKFSLTSGQFKQLCGFINESFIKNSDGSTIITSQESSGRITFFKSVYKYHLFNTCNTWIAKALKNSGIEVSDFFIITSGQLYRSIKDHGVILKKLQ